MNRLLFTTAVLLEFTVPLRADAPPKPRNADPVFALAQAAPDGSPMVFLRSIRVVSAIAERKENRMGKDGKTYDVMVLVPAMISQEMKLDPGKVPVFDASGKKVDPKTVLQRLKKETAVVISLDGQPVDPVFLSALKEGTLILIPPWNPRDQPEPKEYPEPDPRTKRPG